MDQRKIRRPQRGGHAEFQITLIGEAAEGLRQTTFMVFCECGYAGCREKVEVDLSDYERVRAHPRRFNRERGEGTFT